MLQNCFSIRQFWLTKWSFLVHSTTRNADYIQVHPSHNSILEVWRTFTNAVSDNSALFKGKIVSDAAWILADIGVELYTLHSKLHTSYLVIEDLT